MKNLYGICDGVHPSIICKQGGECPVWLDPCDGDTCPFWAEDYDGKVDESELSGLVSED